jgi:hypothetical protein
MIYLPERKPWTDGIDSKRLWTYTPGDRFTRKSIRNDALWGAIVLARKELIAKALAWREAAMADGWSSQPTYEHESELTAFRLVRDRFQVQGLARPETKDTVGSGEISCWGPDGLHVPVGETYDWPAILRAVETCQYCKAHPVKTERVGFAGRCCAACLPDMRRRIETPGWAE